MEKALGAKKYNEASILTEDVLASWLENKGTNIFQPLKGKASFEKSHEGYYAPLTLPSRLSREESLVFSNMLSQAASEGSAVRIRITPDTLDRGVREIRLDFSSLPAIDNPSHALPAIYFDSGISKPVGRAIGKSKFFVRLAVGSVLKADREASHELVQGIQNNKSLTSLRVNFIADDYLFGRFCDILRKEAPPLKAFNTLTLMTEERVNSLVAALSSNMTLEHLFLGSLYQHDHIVRILEALKGNQKFKALGVSYHGEIWEIDPALRSKVFLSKKGGQ